MGNMFVILLGYVNTDCLKYHPRPKSMYTEPALSLLHWFSSDLHVVAYHALCCLALGHTEVMVSVKEGMTLYFPLTLIEKILKWYRATGLSGSLGREQIKEEFTLQNLIQVGRSWALQCSTISIKCQSLHDLIFP